MYIEDDQNKNKTGVAAGDTSIGSGGLDPSQDAGSGASGGTSNAPSQPEKNQNFATVQDYLKANTTQGNDLGDKFAGKLDTTLSGEKSAIDTGANVFGGEVNAGTVNADTGLVNSAVNNPTSVANDPNKLTDWMKQYNAAYSGPTSFESSDAYKPAAQAANEAGQKAQLVKETGGREQLLQDEFNDYGQGNRGLDQALLQNSGRSADIQAFAPKFAGAADYLKNASTNAAGKVTAGVNTSQATKDAAHTAVDPKLGQLQDSLKSRVSADQAQGNTVASKYKTDLATGNIDGITKDLQDGNVPADQVESISSYLKSLRGDYGIAPDASQFYNGNPAVDTNPATVASKDEFDNAAAYGKLTGVDSTGILNPADASKAGTWDTAKAGTDVNSLADYLKGNLATQDKTALAEANSPALVAFDHNDTTVGARKASALVNALKRSGVSFTSDPKTWPPLLKSAVSAFNGIINGGTRNSNADGGTAGLKAFVSTVTRLADQK